MEKAKRNFWLKVAGVGLAAGLIGGGGALGIDAGIQHFRQENAVKVPAGSNRAGGTKVNQNQANLSNQSTKAYNATKNAVVSVINKQAPPTGGLGGLIGGPASGPGQSQGGQSGQKLQTASEGSGVIYKKSGKTAYIVTNNHVVDGSSALQVILSNGKTVDAQIVGTDATTDLAVLKINAADVTTVASFGNSNQIAAGQDVLAIGSPMGAEYANTVTQGIISAKKRTIKASANAPETTVIQTDAAINSGNSGGPLINMAGQVIGINSMKLAAGNDGSSVEGMGFSIPSNEVVRVINQLVKSGKITRPALGVAMVNLANVAADQQRSVLKLPERVTNGAVIMKVNAGSAAEKAGLKQYDVITGINGKAIGDAGDLKMALYKYKVGDTITVDYYHEGQKQATKVKLTEAASANQATSQNQPAGQDPQQ